MKRQKNGIWKLTDAEMCEIANAFAIQAEHCAAKGYEASAEYYNEKFETIFDLLDEAHYFDDVREGIK